MKKRNKEYKKIVLLLLPYWDPLVPPQGISVLKTYLKKQNFDVKTYDANINVHFKKLYNKYFGLLNEFVPQDKQGNFYNIGHDVLRNHMLAYLNKDNDEKYRKTIISIIHETFYTEINFSQYDKIETVVIEIYNKLNNYIEEIINLDKPDVMGVSVMRDTIGASVFAFQIAKKLNPSILTVMGGTVFQEHLAEGNPNYERFINNTPYIDKIIIGDGKELFIRMLQGKLENSQKVYSITDFREFITVKDIVEIPDMTDFDVENDYPYIATQGSFSCPFECSFCNVRTFAGEYKEKNINILYEEIKQQYNQYGKRLFFMNDSLINHIIDNVAQKLIDEKLPVYLDGYLRVGEPVCNLDSTILWRRGGLYRVRIGVESGSQSVLNSMEKKITPELIYRSLDSLAKAGIKTTTYWVIGHPGETEEDFQETLKLLEECKNNIYEAECNPFIYSYNGQNSTDKWADKRKLLYPEYADDYLIFQSWKIETTPTREETFSRINRFVSRCKELEIPNPYSITDIYSADQRWNNLHINSVPSLIEVNHNMKDLLESREIENCSLQEYNDVFEGDFHF